MSNLVTIYQVQGQSVTTSTLNRTENFAPGAVTTLEIDITVTAIAAGASITFSYYRLDSYANPYLVWSSGISATGTITESIGPGMNVPRSVGSNGYLAWTLTGTTPTATFTAMIQGR